MPIIQSVFAMTVFNTRKKSHIQSHCQDLFISFVVAAKTIILFIYDYESSMINHPYHFLLI
jgi:hypothetical protein